MLLSIVSGTYQRLDHLQNMVASARNQLPLGIVYEFVIVDGGSTDGTIEWAKAQPDTRLIEHGELRGAIPAFCDGATKAAGKYVILANDDVTFQQGSILRAVVHLENNPRCGAVGFADNRPVALDGNGVPIPKAHRVERIAAQMDGMSVGVNYAQVGMFRKFLGDRVGWWGAETGMKGARTYGGDCYLSAKIWELGYTVDAVDGCKVDDHIVVDELRKNNGTQGDKDSATYLAAFPERGVIVANEPQIANPDKRQLRVLYCPIYEPGHVNQHTQKKGLREALAKRYLVYELDYVAIGPRDIRRVLFGAIEDFCPDVLLTQVHGLDIFNTTLFADIRQNYPRIVIVNWNGDVWEQHLTAAPMLEMLKHVDLQLVVNASVLATYEQHRIPSAYWQVASEPVDESDLPDDIPQSDVVWLASDHSSRKNLHAFLRREFPQDVVRIWGNGWPDAEGECTYDFRKGRAIYRRAKIALGDNQFPDYKGFISNRYCEILAAGGAIMLHQYVQGMDELTGLIPDTHYVAWTDYDDLKAKINYWLDPAQDKARRKMAASARQFVEEYHSFDARVRELFTGPNALLKKARREIGNTITLEYIGRRLDQFGELGRTGKQYTVNPGLLLTVDATDAEGLLGTGRYRKVNAVANTGLLQAVEG